MKQKFPIQLTLLLALFMTCSTAHAQDDPVDKVSNKMDIDSKFRLSFSYGWSRRLSSMPARLSSQERDFEKALQSGQNIRLSFHHYAEGNFGIGLKFNQFSTSHSDELTVFDGQTGQSFTDIVSEEISATMYGLSGVGRERFNDSFQLNYGISFGVFV